MVRAKFRINTRTEHNAGGYEITLAPVMGKEGENSIFGAATPTGSAKLHFRAKAIADEFTPGREVYLDFTDLDGPCAQPELTGGLSIPLMCWRKTQEVYSKDADMQTVELRAVTPEGGWTEPQQAIFGNWPQFSVSLGITNASAAGDFKVHGKKALVITAA